MLPSRGFRSFPGLQISCLHTETGGEKSLICCAYGYSTEIVILLFSTVISSIKTDDFASFFDTSPTGRDLFVLEPSISTPAEPTFEWIIGATDSHAVLLSA